MLMYGKNHHNIVTILPLKKKNKKLDCKREAIQGRTKGKMPALLPWMGSQLLKIRGSSSFQCTCDRRSWGPQSHSPVLEHPQLLAPSK